MTERTNWVGSAHVRVGAIVTVVLITSSVLPGCGLLPGRTAQDLVDTSTAPVLVPEDNRFRDQWHFTLDEAANNYTIRAHWDPTYNPNIDNDLTVIGFEINDQAAWTGWSDSETPEQTEAKQRVLVDSIEMASDGPCRVVSTSPEVVRCTYDGGRGEDLRPSCEVVRGRR